MKILLDTSILVAAMVEAHPFHEQGLIWFTRVTNGTDEGVVAAHSLAELYSILTTLPSSLASHLTKRGDLSNTILSKNLML